MASKPSRSVGEERIEHHEDDIDFSSFSATQEITMSFTFCGSDRRRMAETRKRLGGASHESAATPDAVWAPRQAGSPRKKPNVQLQTG
jgi:hypothetical protein